MNHMKTMEAGSPRFAALSYKNFRLLWSGLIVSNMGTWMQNVASVWLVLQLTNSPLWLGLLGFSFAVPTVILALLVLSSVAAIFGRSYQSLLPAFSRDIWHAGTEGYGLLLAAAGGGALVGAFGLA